MGHQFKSSTDQECELVAGAMPVCLLGTIKVPLSLAPNLTTTLGAMLRGDTLALTSLHALII